MGAPAELHALPVKVRMLDDMNSRTRLPNKVMRESTNPISQPIKFVSTYNPNNKAATKIIERNGFIVNLLNAAESLTLIFSFVKCLKGS